jgi:hypothetical protein
MSERRSQTRCSCEASALAATAFTSLEVWQTPVRDIAATGVSIRLQQYLEPGTLVTIGLLDRSANLWHLKVSRVVHATRREDGSWLTGHAFLRELTDEQLHCLLR